MKRIRYPNNGYETCPLSLDLTLPGQSTQGAPPSRYRYIVLCFKSSLLLNWVSFRINYKMLKFDVHTSTFRPGVHTSDLVCMRVLQTFYAKHRNNIQIDITPIMNHPSHIQKQNHQKAFYTSPEYKEGLTAEQPRALVPAPAAGNPPAGIHR